MRRGKRSGLSKNCTISDKRGGEKKRGIADKKKELHAFLFVGLGAALRGGKKRRAVFPVLYEKRGGKGKSGWKRKKPSPSRSIPRPTCRKKKSGLSTQGKGARGRGTSHFFRAFKRSVEKKRGSPAAWGTVRKN